MHIVSNLVFYAQSTSMVISGQGYAHKRVEKLQCSHRRLQFGTVQ